MKRILVFIVLLLIAIILGYPLYSELIQLREIKTAKKNFQNTQMSRTDSKIPVRKSTDHWNRYSQSIQKKFKKVGFIPASLPNDYSSFELRDLQDNPHELKDYLGDWVLINFWATWCPPCKMEMPSLKNLQAKLSDRNLQILGINVQETKSIVMPFQDRYQLNFPILLDRNGRIGNRYQLTGVPETWLISTTGNSIAKVNGPKEWDQESMINLFTNLTSIE